MKILVTGSSGYIGSHILHLLNEKYPEAAIYGLDRRYPVVNNTKNVHQKCDVSHVTSWPKTFKDSFDIVVHCAADISVEESVKNPTKYYQNNLFNTILLAREFSKAHFIFCSTGAAAEPTTPYALSKRCAEHVIQQLDKYTIFRFYNVAGSNGLYGQGKESNHIIKATARAAVNNGVMIIFGNDYPTVDGTCVRTYVHVMDIAHSVINAIEDKDHQNTPFENLGDEVYTNQQIVYNMDKLYPNQFEIKYADRREGDPASIRMGKKSKYLNSKYTLTDMCKSAYEWEKIYNENTNNRNE